MIRAQPGRGDVIDDAGAMIKELVQLYQQKHGFYPQRLLIYRDGVSESQFYNVAYREISSIKNVWKTFTTEKTPTITFIVVNKRHHARFTPQNEREADKDGNLLPGTVIDRGISYLIY